MKVNASRGSLQKLLQKVRSCQVCKEHLPFEPRPVLRASATAVIMIVGQAPGRKVHETGIPWNDPSGDRLRLWLKLSKDEFYDESRIAIIPTGFCYPGKARGGDLPPRPECAPLWHPSLKQHLPRLKLTLLIGSYAQKYYLREKLRPSLAETVQAYRDYLPDYFPLPHPSPRNIRWFKTHPWFEKEIVPEVRRRVHEMI